MNVCGCMCPCAETLLSKLSQRHGRLFLKTASVSLALLVISFAALGQKRNGRSGATPSPPPPASEQTKGNSDPTRYTYEFTQRQFVISHVQIEHDAIGHGKM